MKLFENQVVVSDSVLFSAFRYALGRRTYVVLEVAESIKQNADNISVKISMLIIKEIKDAVGKDAAGMDMDVEVWLDCRQAVQQSLAKRNYGAKDA